MGPRQLLRFLLMLLGFALAACGGGSGSSGFDASPQSENAAINQALHEQRCIARHGLTICPAGQEGELSPTATPGGLPTTTPAAPAATPTLRTVPTPTPTPTSGPAVSTDVSAGAPVPCVATNASCSFTLAFVAQGFPPSAAYRIAIRTIAPPARWMIGPALVAPAPSAAIKAPIVLATAASPADGGSAVQLAVLVFFNPETLPPADVEQLADSGADFAFVTGALTVLPE